MLEVSPLLAWSLAMVAVVAVALASVVAYAVGGHRQFDRGLDAGSTYWFSRWSELRIRYDEVCGDLTQLRAEYARATTAVDAQAAPEPLPPMPTDDLREGVDTTAPAPPKQPGRTKAARKKAAK